MHKCPECGQEFDGKFCPECGTLWQEDKICPNCGAKLAGSVKFCNECGYSFVKKKNPSKKSFDFKSKLSAAWLWVKKHWKIVVPIIVAVIVTVVLSCTIPACVASRNNGTYYKLGNNGELDKTSYFIINSGKWEDEDGESGTYKLDGNKIVFYYTFFGETEEIADGTLENFVLIINGDTYVCEKHKHSYSEWHFNDEKHWQICDVCKQEEISMHDNLSWCSVCGYSAFDYKLNEDGASYTVTGIIDKNATTASIPAVFKGLPVTTIGKGAFSGCSGLTNVTIPDSVTTIGSYTFSGCVGLTSVTIPESVITIGSSAFWECSGLSSVTISNGVTIIVDGAFKGCSGLTSVTIPDSVTVIGVEAFSGCSGLESLTVNENNTTYNSNGNCIIETASKKLILGCKNSVIPNDGSVTTIGSSAFDGCIGLTSLTIPDDVTTIDGGAFNKCSGLMSVTIGNGVTTIGRFAFYGCSELTSVAIPESVTTIGDDAFYGCVELTNMFIPDSVTTIGGYTFSSCSGLTSVTIGNGVRAIGNGVFYGCDRLTEVTIGKNVKIIGDSTFYGCIGLSIVYYLGTADEWSKITIDDNRNVPLTHYAERYYYSETRPTGEGSYWHYDIDGVTPVIW